jgi:hypothetical protein
MVPHGSADRELGAGGRGRRARRQHVADVDRALGGRRHRELTVPDGHDHRERRRGVHRVYTSTFDGRTWRWWRDAPGFNQRFEGVIDGATITGAFEMSEDGETWRKDFDVVYRKR